LLGLAVTVLQNYETIYANAVEKGKALALSEAADKGRKKDLDANNLTSKKGEALKGELTESHKNVAAVLGLKGKGLKTYHKLLGKSTVSMGD